MNIKIQFMVLILLYRNSGNAIASLTACLQYCILLKWQVLEHQLSQVDITQEEGL